MYVRQDVEEAVKLISQGALHTQELISNYFSVRDTQAAYQYVDDHFQDVMKVMLTFSERRY
ncbi:hypothetical protein CSB45_14135 [candidate division KSB3 bacterium]|uniref:Uncharacterized protein n=1 Tax=candidate division KSB3 bacterium TaxID=2044937 RepID=A0A2G6E192_9BACT|nr:MAG: hypothetical protein CSB45_14135 [candidate division KSB3 bacterium]PIE28465.1 MAG: hypothetical protein CSA57_13780 [candidate division KSB3 bacterium]